MAKGIDEDEDSSGGESIKLNDDEKLRLALERYIQHRTNQVKEEMDRDD